MFGTGPRNADPITVAALHLHLPHIVSTAIGLGFRDINLASLWLGLGLGHSIVIVGYDDVRHRLLLIQS